MFFGALITSTGVVWGELEAEISQDTVIQCIKQGLQSQDKQYTGFHLLDGSVRYKGRYVIPRTSKFVSLLLSEYHDSVMGSHAGELKTYLRLAGEWFWVGMRHVAQHVRQCVICQQQKYYQQSTAGLLQPLPIPTAV